MRPFHWIEDNSQVVHQILQEGLRLPKPSILASSTSIYQDIMLDKCWKEHPEERASFVELLGLLQSIQLDDNYITLDA